MKKILLISTISVAAFGMTAEPTTTDLQWNRLLDTSGIISSVVGTTAAPDGDYYVATEISAGATSIKWGDEEITLPSEITMNFQKNFALNRVTSEGNLVWSIVPACSNFSGQSSLVASTTDGGLILCGMGTFNKNGANAPLLLDVTDTHNQQLILNYPNAPEGICTYAGIILKIAADGAIEWGRVIAGDDLEGTVTKPLEIKALAVDAADNIYIAGRYRTSIDFGDGFTVADAKNVTDITNAQTTQGDAFFAKLNDNGETLAILVNSDATAPYAKSESIDRILVDGDKLYFAANVCGLQDTDYDFMGNSLDLPALDGNIVYGYLTCDELTLKAVYKVDATANSKNTHVTQIQGISKYGDNLYISGAVNGGFAQGETDFGASVDAKLEGFTVGIDMTTLLAKNLYMNGANIGADFKAIEDATAGKLFAAGYTMSKGTILAEYDLATAEKNNETVLTSKNLTIFSADYYPANSRLLIGMYTKALTIPETDVDFTGLTAFTGDAVCFALPDITPTSGITTIANDEDADNAPIEYYNLQGIRISAPQSGTLVIRRQGNIVTKNIIK